MQQFDCIQRFIFENTAIRGEIVRLNDSFETIMQQHHYPNDVRVLLAETLLSAVLLSATLKYQGDMTLQFQSDGPIRMIVAKCNEMLQIRGLAQFDPEKIIQPHKSFLLKGGQLVVTISQIGQVDGYQSIIPLNGNSIAENIEEYFGQSVQIPTKILLAVNENSAVGILLQLLPSDDQSISEREDFWKNAVKIGETITQTELLNLDNTAILQRLYTDDIRLFEEQSIQFQCQCSLNKMKNIIKTIGKKDVEEILNEKNVVDITCEYCNTVYSFNKSDIQKLLMG